MNLALDPSRTPPIIVAKPWNTIKKGHANYVQVIHTSKLAGTWSKLGDTDIYVDFKEKQKSLYHSIIDNHGLAFFIHIATATKRLYLIAGENKIVTMIKRDAKIRNFVEPTPNENECLIGIYSTVNQQLRGKKYEISFQNRTDDFWKALGRFSNDKIFFEKAKPPIFDDMLELEKNNQIEVDPNVEE